MVLCNSNSTINPKGHLFPNPLKSGHSEIDCYFLTIPTNKFMVYFKIKQTRRVENRRFKFASVIEVRVNWCLKVKLFELITD